MKLFAWNLYEDSFKMCKSFCKLALTKNLSHFFSKVASFPPNFVPLHTILVLALFASSVSKPNACIFSYGILVTIIFLPVGNDIHEWRLVTR